MLILLAVVNFVLGALIGMTGIGFMLPVFYLAVVGLSATEAMAFSFCAFLVSGILSTLLFARKGAVDWRVGTWLSGGSVLGTLAGVAINLMLPEGLITYILYIMVLVSGLSILWPRKKAGGGARPPFLRKGSVGGAVLCLGIGLVTGCICSVAGAGGPILVIPILALLGMPIHTVIGTAMYNSIFIAAVAFPQYFWAAGGREIPYFSWLPLLLALYGAGVLAGGCCAFRVNQLRLKQGIAVLCIGVALYQILL